MSDRRTFLVITNSVAFDAQGRQKVAEARQIKVKADRFYETPAGSLAFENYTGPRQGWVGVRTIAAGKWEDCVDAADAE